MKRPNAYRYGVGAALAALLALPMLLMPLLAHANDNTIRLADDGFEPTSIQIKKNVDRISWANDGQTFHTVDAQGSAPQPEPRQLGAGQQTNYVTFSSNGTYKYRMDNRPEFELSVIVTDNPTSPSPTPSGTITVTLTPTPTPTPTKKKTSTPTPSPSASSASPSPSPSPSTPTPTPTPSPSEPSDSASPLPTITSDTTGGTSSGNTQALIAIVGVLVLGAIGFLVYRRTLSRP